MSGNPITFDLTVDQPDALSMSFVQDGLTLDISAALFNGKNGEDLSVYEFSPMLSIDANGLGALNPYNDLEHGFDGDGKQEVAALSFGAFVKITSISLTPLGTRYNLTGENTKFILFDQGLVADITSEQVIDPTDFTNEVALYGNYLGIGAHYRFDQFRIASITVEYVDLTSVADSAAVLADATPTTIDVLANDTDARQVTAISLDGTHGLATISADGKTVAYDPNGAFAYLGVGETATDTFTYTVLGWDGTSETQTVTVTVTGVAPPTTDYHGTEGRDQFYGTDISEVFYTYGDNDVVYGYGGHDFIDAGAGNDGIVAGAGNDTIYCGAGNDRIWGEAGNDTIYGGTENDTIYGGQALDTIYGEDGNDLLYGGTGIDMLDGGNGRDRLYGEDGDDVMIGGEGDDTLDGGIGLDQMTGGIGNDTYYVDNAGDVVTEQSGQGTDRIYAGFSYALGANIENLTLSGTAAINGTGNALVNRLIGNDAANVLTGLAGNDNIEGGAGADTLIGGTGRDRLTGGAGVDTFQFGEFASTDTDTILDFEAGIDAIHLVGSVFGFAQGALGIGQFTLGTAAVGAGLQMVYDQATGNLYFDTDGAGGVRQVMITSVADGTLLAADDVFVI